MGQRCANEIQKQGRNAAFPTAARWWIKIAWEPYESTRVVRGKGRLWKSWPHPQNGSERCANEIRKQGRNAAFPTAARWWIKIAWEPYESTRAVRGKGRLWKSWPHPQNGSERCANEIQKQGRNAAFPTAARWWIKIAWEPYEGTRVVRGKGRLWKSWPHPQNGSERCANEIQKQGRNAAFPTAARWWIKIAWEPYKSTRAVRGKGRLWKSWPHLQNGSEMRQRDPEAGAQRCFPYGGTMVDKDCFEADCKLKWTGSDQPEAWNERTPKDDEEYGPARPLVPITRATFQDPSSPAASESDAAEFPPPLPSPEPLPFYGPRRPLVPINRAVIKDPVSPLASEPDSATYQSSPSSSPSSIDPPSDHDTESQSPSCGSTHKNTNKKCSS